MSIAEKLTTIAENVPLVYERGREIGYVEGNGIGYDAGYEAGKAEGGGGTDLWDLLQDNGNRTDYAYGFAGHLWTDATFKPKYPVKVTDASYLFYRSLVTDVSGAELDFSRITGNVGSTRVFSDSEVTKVGTVDLSNATGTLNTFFGYATAGSSRLETIGLLKLPTTGVNIFGTNFFQNCSVLKNIEIEGVINGDLNMSACPLTTESVQSIIDHLKDLAGATTKTLTLSSSALITDAQKATITAKNWTLVS